MSGNTVHSDSCTPLEMLICDSVKGTIPKDRVVDRCDTAAAAAACLLPRVDHAFSMRYFRMPYVTSVDVTCRDKDAKNALEKIQFYTLRFVATVEAEGSTCYLRGVGSLRWFIVLIKDPTVSCLKKRCLNDFEIRVIPMV